VLRLYGTSRAVILYAMNHTLDMLGSALGRLRIVGMVEGASFLLLLGIAMPLKYIWGMPHYVTVVGAAHGALWIAYLIALVDVRFARRWDMRRVAIAFIASIVPFGPFLLDPRLRREQHETEAADRSPHVRSGPDTARAQPAGD
jgi:integral membrane protein